MPTTCPFTRDKRAACEQYSGCCPQGLGPIEGGGGGGGISLLAATWVNIPQTVASWQLEAPLALVSVQTPHFLQVPRLIQI